MYRYKHDRIIGFIEVRPIFNPRSVYHQDPIQHPAARHPEITHEFRRRIYFLGRVRICIIIFKLLIVRLSVTMRADPHEGLELEYFFEGKDRDGKIIRTDIMKKIIEPPKSCINSFTIKEERVLMYCNFAFRTLDFWTSDMIIELQVYDPSCGRWMKVSSTLRTEVPQIARELPKYEYDTVTRRISLLCGVSKFSAYSEPRVSLLPKKQIIKEGFTTQRFVYADRTLNYPP